MYKTSAAVITSPKPLTSAEISSYYRARVPALKQDGAEWRGPCPIHNGSRDSFSVVPDTGQWFCHSECATGGNVFTLEEKLGGTAGEVYAVIGRNAARQIVATYGYTDESGRVLFECVRFQPKDFRQRRPDGHGGFLWNVKGVRLVPYRLPQVLAADSVYVVEGEKDVHTLEGLGVTATTSPMGASSSLTKTKWRAEYNRYFAGKHVVILPDQDEPGQMHAGTVARNLLPVAASVKVVNIPAGKDISDWVAAGATAQDLAALVEDAVPYVELTANGANLVPALRAGWNDFKALIERPSDGANGEVFSKVHSGLARWVPEFDKWIVWSEEEGRWAVDDSLTIHQLAVSHIRNMRQAALDLHNPDLMKHAVWTESKGHTDSMISYARSFMVTHPDKLDSNLYLLNAKNGTVNLKTGELQPHQKLDFITKLVPIEYNPEARSEEFEKFLLTIMCGDQEMVNFLQVFTGYSLCGWTGERKLVCCHGQTGCNGKSTFRDVLQMIGGEYYTSAQK